MEQIVHVFVRFCLVLNPTMCQELEIAPIERVVVQDGVKIPIPMPATKLVECMKGVMSRPQAEFTYQGARWMVHGGRCATVPAAIGDIQRRLRANLRDQPPTP